MSSSTKAGALFALAAVAGVAAQSTTTLSDGRIYTGGLAAPTTGGDAAARTGRPAGRPTQSWSQWQPKPSYAVNQLPDQYMGANRIPGYSEPQSGFNTCADGWNQQSQCQTAWVNSLEDFCIWGPPSPGTIGETERRAVAYCTQPNHGTRLIPDGTITGAHFVQTSEYVQVTGVGDFTSIGVPLGDDGGEMDSAGMDDLSNPIGGVMYTTSAPGRRGQNTFATEWTNFMSWNQFCVRLCFGNNAERHCEHVYDVLGCQWNIPANYGAGVFETCDGALAPFQGRYVQADGSTSTFSQGQAVTPQPHPAPSSSNCQARPSNSNGLIRATPVGLIAQSSSTAAASSSGAAGSTGAAASGSSAAAGGASTAGSSGAATTSRPNSVATLKAFGATGLAIGAGALAVFALAA